MAQSAAYPESYLDLDVRKLLRHSQTDMTPDPYYGYLYAAAAYDKATVLGWEQEAGEAAAKAGFRGQQAQLDTEVVDLWLEGAIDLLQPYPREQISAFTLAGRALHLRILVSGNHGYPDRLQAKQWFERGHQMLHAQHIPGQAWDRYATMHSRQYAAFEGMQRNGGRGVLLAMDGIRQAQAAYCEHPDQVAEHVEFVQKHTKANILAGVLAASKAVRLVPGMGQWRRKQALRLVG